MVDTQQGVAALLAGLQRSPMGTIGFVIAVGIAALIPLPGLPEPTGRNELQPLALHYGLLLILIDNLLLLSVAGFALYTVLKGPDALLAMSSGTPLIITMVVVGAIVLAERYLSRFVRAALARRNAGL